MQAREAFPEDPDVAKALGIMMYRQSDYARAVGLLKESASKLTTDATLMYYLGMAQYRNNNQADCKRSLQRALELNLNDELGSTARQTLAVLK
jgi:Flp pilus assembly protein TadD